MRPLSVSVGVTHPRPHPCRSPQTVLGEIIAFWQWAGFGEFLGDLFEHAPLLTQ